MQSSVDSLSAFFLQSLAGPEQRYPDWERYLLLHHIQSGRFGAWTSQQQSAYKDVLEHLLKQRLIVSLTKVWQLTERGHLWLEDFERQVCLE